MGIRQSKTSLNFKSQGGDWPWVWAIRDGSVLDWKNDLESDDEIQAQANKQQELPVQISDTLYLGSAASIQNVSRLQEMGITSVLNMAGKYALRSQTIKCLEDRGT